MPPSIWSYVAGGAGDESTQRANVTAFSRWGLIPRMLVAATERDLSVELWGRRWPAPVFMAPIGVIGLCTTDRHGDLAAARTGVPMCVSTLTMDPLEDVAAEFGDTPGLFPTTVGGKPTEGCPPSTACPAWSPPRVGCCSADSAWWLTRAKAITCGS